MSCNGSESLQASKQDLNHSHHHAFISSAEKVINLEDLLYEILLRLPTKSLLRFQCVSKRWLSIISNSHFSRLQTRKITSASSPSAVFLVGESKKSPIYLSKSDDMYRNNKTIPSNMETILVDNGLPRWFILHSCNGLVCITVPVSKSSSYVCSHVYNPCTQQYTNIRRPDYKQSGYLSALNLAFDPSKSDQFKIICVWEDMIEFSFYVYSSETDSWKDSGISLDARHYRYGFPDYGSCQYFFRNGVFLDGKIHWVSNTKPFLCFDTDSERFRAMPSTSVPSERGRNVRYFGESGGHLHLIEESNRRSTFFNVLELGGDYSEWYSKYQVDLEFITRMYPLVVDDYGDFKCEILSLLWEKDEQKMKLLLSIPEKIVSFDVDDGTINELLDVEPERGPYKWYHAYKHLESLADL